MELDLGFANQAVNVGRLVNRYSRFVREGGLSKFRKRLRTTGWAGTETETKRKMRTAGDPSDYSRTRLVRGRKQRQNLRQLWKLQRIQTSPVIYGSQNISTYGVGVGAVPLVNHAVDSASTLTCPCHIYDITAAPNIVASGTTITNPFYRWVPTFTNTTSSANVGWVNDTNLTIQQADGPQSGSTANAPLAHSMLDYVNAKFLFYAPTVLPVRISAVIFQLDDERLVPGFDGVTRDDLFSTAFWQSVLKRYMYNPLETGAPDYAKHMRVLASKTMYLQPKDSTEAVLTKYKQLDMFMRFNRAVNYRWRIGDKVSMLTDDGQVNADASNALENTPHPKARIFLGIFAQAGPSTTLPNIQLHPSYDYKIQIKHKQVTG